MKTWTSVFIALSCCLFLQAQSPTYAHTVSLHLLGQGSVMSMNYEKVLFHAPQAFVAAQVGLGFNCQGLECDNWPGYTAVLPHRISASFGGEQHYVEFGVGGTFLMKRWVEERYMLFPVLAYRWLPHRFERLCFRLSFSPMIPLGADLAEVELIYNEDVIAYPVGIEVGFRLKK